MLVPLPLATAVLKFVPPKTVCPPPTLRAPCHWTPNSAASPVETSTMSAST
jgi:hypothetical protein